MKKLPCMAVIVIALTIAAANARAQNTIEGHWEGTMIREAAHLQVSFDFSTEAQKVVGYFNSSTLRAIGIPLRSVGYIGSKVHFELVGDATTSVFDGEMKADTITGIFRDGNAQGTFSMWRAPAKPPSFKLEEVSFRNGDATLSGTLFVPSTQGPHPAVVFLHGAGPEARQGSRFLAEYLTEHGVATLIYDKRGVGKSSGDWKRSDFTDLAEDAIAAVRFLQGHQAIHPRKIGLYGHSQGGMIVPLAASRSKEVAFIISGAGSAVPVYESEINSITNQVRAKGITGSELEDASRFIRMWVDVMRTGRGWQEFDIAVEKARAAKWFPMLRVPPKDNWIWDFHRRIYDYDSAEYWTRVYVPALIMYGERDLYVPVEQSVRNIDRALSYARNSDYTIVIFPRASHSFNVEPESGQPFEWPHIAPGFPSLLTAWITQRMR